MTGTNNIQKIANIEDKELFNMLKGAKGGQTRIRILDAILAEPSNANQLAKKLNLDYFHLVLIFHKLVYTVYRSLSKYFTIYIGYTI